MKIHYLLRLCETQTCLEHKSESKSNAHWGLFKRQLYLIYGRVLPEDESCLINIFSAESDTFMYVCVSEHVWMNVLSLSDVEPETTFSPSDLRLVHFLRNFRNFPKHLFSHLRPFFTATKTGRKHTFSKTDRMESSARLWEKTKNLTWQQRWHSRHQRAEMISQLHASMSFFFSFFLHLSRFRNVFCPLQH